MPSSYACRYKMSKLETSVFLRELIRFFLFFLYSFFFFLTQELIRWSSSLKSLLSFKALAQFKKYLAHNISLCLRGLQCMSRKRGNNSGTTYVTEKKKRKNTSPIIFHSYSIYNFKILSLTVLGPMMNGGRPKCNMPLQQVEHNHFHLQFLILFN